MTDIKERTFKFGLMIIKIVEVLPKNTVGYAIGNQVIRSGTAIGSILEEASIIKECDEINRILTKSIATSEQKQGEYKIKRKKQ